MKGRIFLVVATIAGLVWAFRRQSIAAITGAASGAVPVPGISNGRRIPQGYVLSAMIDSSSVPVLVRERIKLVISLVTPDAETRSALAAMGIHNVIIPTGSTWDITRGMHAIQAVSGYSPSNVLIHCTHGVDRTGAVTAFLLAVRHGWSISNALYAVVEPTGTNTNGLAEVLLQAGIDDWRDVSDPTVGIYSLAPLNQIGGMKVNNESYRQLVATTIGTIEAMS